MTTRLNGAKLKIEVNNVDYSAQLGSWVVNAEEADKDFVTFTDAAAGGASAYTLDVTAFQSTDSDSFWTYINENAGNEVAYTLIPNGNETASVSQPHFTGNLIVGRMPTLGGEAGTKTLTFDYTFELTGKPVKVTS